jgi:xylan 1,4-beta-xylosidase
MSAHKILLSPTRASLLVLIAVLCGSALEAQQSDPVSIQIHADHVTGTSSTAWNFFGYDEPNYTYAPNGQKLLHEIAGLSPTPAYIRVHNILTTGDGAASLKWGSTNAYTEDANGKPVYDWKIIDRIFDTFHDSGLKPLVEIGFMPEALSTHPEPYRHNFPNGSIFTGWAYPPKDYNKWSELVFQFAKHLRERYGDAEVKTWLWEVWNEPDIPYWQGTHEEYFKLYDYSVDAVLRAIPGAKVGGPDATGISERSAQFLTDFLQHCDTGRNYATGKQGAPLTFISYHPKGAPAWEDNHMQMGLSTQLKAVERGFKIAAASPKWKNTPIILGEFDPDGCAACTPQRDPRFGYRNIPLYAAYTADAISHTLALAEREHVKLEGIVTWAFEFENQPYFVGYRELANNGVDKPILNLFRMLGLLSHDQIEVSDPAALNTEQVVRDGVRANPDIRVIATRSDHGVQILVWNYHDDDVTVPPASIDLTIDGLPKDAGRALLQHFRIDSDHSNPFAVWKSMGSPQPPTADQHKELESAGQLQLLTSPWWIAVDHGQTRLAFELPRQGLSLIQIGW